MSGEHPPDAAADCKSLATTTIDLPHMNMIIFPTSACLPLCSSTINQLWFSTIQLACCKTFAICCTIQLHFMLEVAVVLVIFATWVKKHKAEIKISACLAFLVVRLPPLGSHCAVYADMQNCPQIGLTTFCLMPRSLKPL